MRARLTYLALSPRTPQLVARRTTEALGLFGGIAVLAAGVSGAASHVLFSAIVAASSLVGAA